MHSALIAWAASAAAQPAARLRVASVTPAPDAAMTIVLESDVPLPRPTVGVLDGPPRIYFDFAGFRPGPSAGVAPDEGIVRGVRIALNSIDPLLTRMVIDLRQPARYRLDTSAAASGRLVILVGAATAAEAPAPRASAGARRAPQRNSAQRLTAVLTELEGLAPLLTAIDGRGETSALDLQAAVARIDSLRALLSAVRPAAVPGPARDRLAQACVLAGQAVKGRLEALATGDTALTWNAASAAAGALLLLERAREDLGLTARPSR